jgi:2-C-methyl-D-erythritol 4-phosphate cytidylyltransferase
VKRAPREAGAGEDLHRIAGTEPREELWAAQTPQVFRTEALRRAFGADPASVTAATDEAMLVERAGGTVLIHPAPTDNLKVTTKADLRLAEVLVRERTHPR